MLRSMAISSDNKLNFLLVEVNGIVICGGQGGHGENCGFRDSQ